MVIRESHCVLGSLCHLYSPSSHPFGVFMSHGDTVLHLRQPSSLESEVKWSQELLERSAKGPAVMWDLEIECNTIYSRDGISRNKRSLAFGQNVFFPNALKSSEISAGKMILAETIHPMREQTESQTRQRQRSIHWSQESFLVSKCKEFIHTSVKQSK